MDKLIGALRSRTVWFNIVTGALEVANLLTGYAPAGILVGVNVAGNIALRFLTAEPLAAKGRRSRRG